MVPSLLSPESTNANKRCMVDWVLSSPHDLSPLFDVFESLLIDSSLSDSDSSLSLYSTSSLARSDLAFVGLLGSGSIMAQLFPHLCPLSSPCFFSTLASRDWVQSVGIQTIALLATLWIFGGHPARNKRAGYAFKFYSSITLTVI